MIISLGTFKLKDTENRQVIKFQTAREDDPKGIKGKDILSFFVWKVRGKNNCVELRVETPDTVDFSKSRELPHLPKEIEPEASGEAKSHILGLSDETLVGEEMG